MQQMRYGLLGLHLNVLFAIKRNGNDQLAQAMRIAVCVVVFVLGIGIGIGIFHGTVVCSRTLFFSKGAPGMGLACQLQYYFSSVYLLRNPMPSTLAALPLPLPRPPSLPHYIQALLPSLLPFLLLLLLPVRAVAG